jgi:ethanolamine utilization protein EutN
MIIGKVIGNVWATRKEETLSGLKLMIVKRMDLAGGGEHESFVAADCVGAGIDERVLVVTGSSARKALRNTDTPMDAAIIGIIDEVEVRPEG